MHVFSTPTAGCSLGFFPFQGIPTQALTRFLALSSHTLSSNDCWRRLLERRPRVSIDSRFAPTHSSPASRRFWPKQPSEGFRAGPFLNIWEKVLSGYVFTLCRAARCRRLADTLWENQLPAGADQDRLWRRAIATSTSQHKISTTTCDRQMKACHMELLTGCQIEVALLNISLTLAISLVNRKHDCDNYFCKIHRFFYCDK